MGDWFKNLGLFFADMYRHTVGQMTGVLSIILALAPLLCPAFFAGDQGLLHSKWTWEVAAAISFFFAAHSAWSEQHKARLEAEQMYFDERPLLGLEVFAPKGPKAWREADNSSNSCWFWLRQLGGRRAMSICFDPIPSKNGKYSLHFDAVPFLDPPRPTSLKYHVVEVRATTLSAHDWDEIGDIEFERLRQFLDDSPRELIEIRYVLTTRFKDRGDEVRERSFNLVFDKTTISFLPNTD